MGGVAKLIAILGANKVSIKIDCVVRAQGGRWFMLIFEKSISYAFMLCHFIRFIKSPIDTFLVDSKYC